MYYRKLGDSDMNCSVIALGTMGMGGTMGELDDAEAIRAIEASIDAGVNFIDTAQPYGEGHAEEVVGKAIAGKRDRVFVATKCGTMRYDGVLIKSARPQEIREQLAASLKRLGVNYIDLYQMHWPVPGQPFEEQFVELDKLRREGLIRYVGVSNFSPEQMDEVRAYCPITSLQPPYSLLDRGIEAEILPYCVKNDIGVLSYGSIGAGALSGKYSARPVFKEDDVRSRFYTQFNEENWPRTSAIIDVVRQIAQERGKPMVQVAINWVLAQKGVTMAIVGARTAQQAADNAAATQWELTGEELARMQQACATI
nr:aldo/keto reductase [Maliibacterium massiliense]